MSELQVQPSGVTSYTKQFNPTSGHPGFGKSKVAGEQQEWMETYISKDKKIYMLRENEKAK